jgi:hypothetical protein
VGWLSFLACIQTRQQFWDMIIYGPIGSQV